MILLRYKIEMEMGWACEDVQQISGNIQNETQLLARNKMKSAHPTWF